MRGHLNLRTVVRSAIALTALVGAAGTSTVAGAQTRIVTRKSMSDTTVRDTVVTMTVNIAPGDVLRMIGELMASKHTEERVAMELRAVRGDRGERADAPRSRELEAQLMSIARRNTGLVSAIRLRCAKESMEPDGYMGLNFEGIEVRRANDGPALYFLGPKPAIVSVEPGSPAERAGLAASDEVVLIGGMDARKPFPLGTVLKPGARVVVRVSRDGRQHDMHLTVAKRPEEYGAPCAGVDDVVSGFRFAPQATFMRRTDLPPGAMPRSANPDPSVAPAGGFGYAFVTPYATGGLNMIGGASFLALDPEWRETLGVDKGLLVLAVAPGSPAQAAGLRKSDVVLAAGDTPIATPGALWRIVNMAGRDGVSLRLLRGKQSVTIVLKVGDGR